MPSNGCSRRPILKLFSTLETMASYHEFVPLDPVLAFETHKLLSGIRASFSAWGQPQWSFPYWQVDSSPRALELFRQSTCVLDRLQAGLLSNGLLGVGEIEGWEILVPPARRFPGFFPWERADWDGTLPEPAGRWEIWRFRDWLNDLWESLLIWNPTECVGLLLNINWPEIVLNDPNLDPDDSEEGLDWDGWEWDYEDRLYQFLLAFELAVETGRQLSLALA